MQFTQQVGGVAVRAHVAPVQVRPRPMEHVAVAHRVVRMQVHPALTALLLGAAVPTDVERLQTPTGKLDQVLLQREDAEGVLDPIVLKRPVGAVGAGSGLRGNIGVGPRYIHSYDLKRLTTEEAAEVRGLPGGVDADLDLVGDDLIAAFPCRDVQENPAGVGFACPGITGRKPELIEGGQVLSSRSTCRQ